MVIVSKEMFGIRDEGFPTAYSLELLRLCLERVLLIKTSRSLILPPVQGR